MSKVVVAGGSGFIGSVLVRALVASGREVTVLSRSGRAPDGAKGVVWNAGELGQWAGELDGAEAVVNLSGAPISRRWTIGAKAEIIDSRVKPTTIIGRAIAACADPPKTWINASAIGVYGNSGAAELDESAAPASGPSFLKGVCAAWEQAMDQAETPGTRKTMLRIGFVLARDGGALPVLATLAKRFMGGAAGNGRQYVSWIHVDDLVRLTVWLLESDAEGPVNATAPNPVTNAEFMATLRKRLSRPWSPPVPAPVLKVYGKLVGPDSELVLHGQRVLPGKALRSGFAFRFSDVERALGDLLSV